LGPDSHHPYHQIEIKDCVWVDLEEVVLSFKFCKNQLMDFRDPGAENCLNPLFWVNPLACTPVKAMMMDKRV